MTAVSANNGSFEFVDIENIIWSGGYVENYSDLQQAALILRNVAGQINIHLVSGSTLVADEPSSRNVRGALQANIRYAGETPTISAWPERFPNPALDAPAAVRAVAVNNMACAADPSGVGLRLTSNMATNSYAQLALSPPADAISALVGIKVLKGSLWIRAQNTQDNAGPTLTPADGHRLVRIASRVGQCRGPWLTGASYQLNDLVWSSGGWYKVTLALSHSTIAPGSDPSHFVAVGTNWPLVRLSCSALDGSGAFEAVITSINLTDVYGFINAPSLACPAYVLGETYPLVNLAAISNEGRVTIPASGNSPLFSMPGKTNTYLIVAHNENAAGSYTVAIATKNGTSLVVTQLMGTGATLSASGANVVLTNSTGTSVDYYWSALRVNW